MSTSHVHGSSMHPLHVHPLTRVTRARPPRGAQVSTANARVSALGEKVKVSREGQMHVARVLEQREGELRAARLELTQTQGQYAALMERALRAAAA